MSNVGKVYGARKERRQKYVDVLSHTSADGLVTPLYIYWGDGRKFKVNSVTERRPARSLKDGGAGIRYTIQVGSTLTHLFFDGTRGAWFVEEKRTRGADW